MGFAEGMHLLENPSMCVLILNYLSIREIKTAGSQRPPKRSGRAPMLSGVS